MTSAEYCFVGDEYRFESVEDALDVYLTHADEWQSYIYLEVWVEDTKIDEVRVSVADFLDEPENSLLYVVDAETMQKWEDMRNN